MQQQLAAEWRGGPANDSPTPGVTHRGAIKQSQAGDHSTSSTTSHGRSLSPQPGRGGSSLAVSWCLMSCFGLFCHQIKVTSCSAAGLRDTSEIKDFQWSRSLHFQTCVRFITPTFTHISARCLSYPQRLFTRHDLYKHHTARDAAQRTSKTCF